MAPSTPPPDTQRRNEAMIASGSSWTSKQSDYFNILQFPAEDHSLYNTLITLVPHKADIHDELSQHLDAVTTRNLTQSTHGDLLLSTPSGTPQNYGTLLGPFLALLATIKEAPYVPRTSPRPQRQRKPVDRGEMVNTIEAVDFSSSEDEGRPESDREHRVDPAYSNESQLTDKSAHLARVKPETPTQVMLYLFCQAVFEGSNLGTRGQSSPRDKSSEHRLEWSVAGKRFEIESPKVRCVSINDGSLSWKRFSPEGYWVTEQPLAYCSIETKAQLLNWENETGGEPSELVKAQEASQMIGMMCERLKTAAKRQNQAVDVDKLPEYDRTVFLISGAQRTMFLKFAIFTPKYIKHFFHQCLVPPPPPAPADHDPFVDQNKDDSALPLQLGQLKLNDDPPPALEIYRTGEYDLSRGDSLRSAARLLLSMGVYLEENGPLLKDIPLAN